MKRLIWIVLLVSGVRDAGLCQSKSYALTTVKDSLAYPFQFISPSKKSPHARVPDIGLEYFSLSRSLKLQDVNRELGVLIGRNMANQKLVIFDSNFNADFSDDPVEVFADTLTSTSKGNYKAFRTKLKMGNRSVSIAFDYTIIKPAALKLDVGDSLENRIFFAVRLLDYRYTKFRVDNEAFKLVLFSKNVLDFSKQSAFLMVVPDSVSLTSMKSTDRRFNRYVPGDIILAGKRKFSFVGVSSLADSLSLTEISAGSDVPGTQIGFLAKEFSGTDFVSKAKVQSKDFAGKYVLLDFWGTWCAPCIQILEAIKQMHEGLDQNKIKMIGVCYDKDVAKASAFVTRRGINWTQIFDPMAAPVICKDFDITEFPSFILIDPSGEIVARETGLNGFERLKANLKTIIK